MDDGAGAEDAAGGQQREQQSAASQAVAGVAAAAGAETAAGKKGAAGGKEAGAGGSGRVCGTVASDAATLPELPATWECPEEEEEEEEEDGKQTTISSSSSSSSANKAAAGTAAAAEGGSGSGSGDDGGGDMIDIEPRGIFDVGNAVTCVATSCCGFSCSSGEGCYGLPFDLCVVCPQPGYDFGAHSILDSYIPRLWSCRLAKSERKKLPAPWEVAKM